ncbi:hypothetical protein [Pseudonocardia adelaidensis]|uniref:hypothetical protein n=1 Tax=Pseudonocardia adelaidensis TaxID=648754 RepID=UPI0031EA17F0
MALGVAGGYLLGRTKKMKLALMLAGMAAGRQAGGPGELLKTGSKLLGSTPELAQLTDQVRGRLLDAGKTAALAVATRQVESLTDRVGKRVESLGDVGLPRQRRSEEPADEPAPRDEYDEDEGRTDEGRADEGRADEGRADEGRADEGRADEGRADEDRDGGRTGAPGDEEAPPARRRPARARAAKSPAATATPRRTAGGTTSTAGSAGKAATGRRTTRNPRTRRSEGDG